MPVGCAAWKDAFGNWVGDPFKEAVVDSVLESTGSLGQLAVEMNNDAVKHADHAVDKGRGHQLPVNVDLPPDQRKKMHSSDYKGFA